MKSLVWGGGSLANSHGLGSERMFEMGMVAPNATRLVVKIVCRWGGA